MRLQIVYDGARKSIEVAQVLSENTVDFGIVDMRIIVNDQVAKSGHVQQSG